MDVNLLNRALEPTENPGLDTFDERLGDITTFAQDGKFDDAAPLISAVFEENIYDVRVIGYYCYAVFLQEGVVGLSNVFSGLAQTLTTNWAAVGPLANKAKVTGTSLPWLFRMLLKKLQYEESQKSSDWERWTEQTGSEQVAQALESGDQLRRAISSALEDQAAASMDHYLKVLEWLRAFQRVVYKPEPEPEPEASREEEAAASEESGRPPSRQSSGEGLMAEASPAFAVLLRKLEAFEQLVGEEKFGQAALIADDVSTIMQSFDPVVYFPRVFASFARLLVVHSKALAEFDEAKETKEWAAMKSYYLMDLDGFLKL